MTKAKLITKMLGLMLLPTCLYASEVEVYGVIDTGIAVSRVDGQNQGLPRNRFYEAEPFWF